MFALFVISQIRVNAKDFFNILSAVLNKMITNIILTNLIKYIKHTQLLILFMFLYITIFN